MGRKLGRLAGLLLMGAALAGCDRPAAPEVPTAVSTASAAPGAAPGTAPADPETDYDKALRYIRCMNEEGIEIADPVVGEPLQTWVSGPSSGGVLLGKDDAGKARTRPPAFDKCKGFLPATWPVKADPETVARDRPFAECMRRQGIAWPAPDADGMIRFPADPFERNAAHSQAEQACRHVLDDPAGRQ